MYLNDTLGVSRYTPTKQKHFSRIMEMHLAVTRAVLDKHSYFNHCYHYIDGSAGPGKYAHPETPDQEIVGSPLRFLTAADEMDLRYRADFIELNGDLCDILRREVSGRAGVVVHQGDYRDKVPEILAESSQSDGSQFGLFYLDLSGAGTTLPDFDVVALIARLRPRMEILIHTPAQIWKRVRGAFPEYWQSLKECIDRSGKPYWLIRKPYVLSLQWTFLMGSGTDLFKRYKAIGFEPLDSDRGMEIFRRLNFTCAEIENELQLVLDL